MAAFTSRTKNNNNSDNEKNILNGIAPSAALPSPVTQLLERIKQLMTSKKKMGHWL